MTDWVTRQGSTVSVEPIGELRAVHVDANGMTHLVDPMSAEVLLFLASGQQTQAAVLAFVRQHLQSPEITWEELEGSILVPLMREGMIEAIV